MTRPSRTIVTGMRNLGWALLTLLLVGCSSEPSVLTDVFPGPGALSGWTPAGEVEMYDRENLYDLVNGQAESFFAYGFEQVAVQNYENAAGVDEVAAGTLQAKALGDR